LVSGVANALDTTTLEPVVVTAATSDNFTVFLPADFIPAARLTPSYRSIGQWDYSTDLTKAQVCKVLKDHPPQNCMTSNYPASPGIPSASGAQWAGNGCGAGAYTTAFLTAALEARHPFTFSGDLNKPVKGNPSIDFTSSCNKHDEFYTNGAEKGFADLALGRHIKEVCDSAVTDGGLCLAFKDTYVSTVQAHGESAYEADQKQLACSAWGSSMKKSGCSS
jgi:hypothetical protein